MREIKFRAWDEDEKRMRFVSCIFWNLGEHYISRFELDGVEIKDQMPIMQYTGLKDKNGKEIYEGDILSYNFSATQHLKGIVGFDDCSFEIKVFYERQDPVGNLVKGWERQRLNYSIQTLTKRLFDMKVIGNVHENPELMKEAKDEIKNI